jgi:hypothetical protein
MDQNPLFGYPQGHAAALSEAFRTVSLGTRVNKPRTLLEVSSFPGHDHVVYVAMS